MRVMGAAAPMLAQTLDEVRSGVFSPDDVNRYVPLVDDLYNHDYFMVTTDFAAYADKQRAVDNLFSRPDDWSRRALINTARMGWFSADRAIREYAADIWGATPNKTRERSG